MRGAAKGEEAVAMVPTLWVHDPASTHRVFTGLSHHRVPPFLVTRCFGYQVLCDQ